MRLNRASFFLFFHVVLFPSHARTATAQMAEMRDANPTQAAWTSSNVQHAYGLPDTKPKQNGRLKVNADGLTFTGKASIYTIPRASIIAVSSGNERVELWGMKGRILRMAIPNGGGLAAAGFMHHKVNMLTVEFNDDRGGYHGAVFYLPAGDAERSLASFADAQAAGDDVSATHHEARTAACQGSQVNPRSVLVAAPVWDQAEVPAAYRAFVYEHIVDRLQHLDGAGHVYREGENNGSQVCPQYTIRISVAGFRQGSQVKRAVMGPAGFFAGTTQMSFNADITDASGRLNVTEQVKATVRGESESRSVADSIAKNLARRYSDAVKNFQRTNVVISPEGHRPR